MSLILCVVKKSCDLIARVVLKQEGKQRPQQVNSLLSGCCVEPDCILEVDTRVMYGSVAIIAKCLLTVLHQKIILEAQKAFFRLRSQYRKIKTYKTIDRIQIKCF